MKLFTSKISTAANLQLLRQTIDDWHEQSSMKVCCGYCLAQCCQSNRKMVSRLLDMRDHVLSPLKELNVTHLDTLGKDARWKDHYKGKIVEMHVTYDENLHIEGIGMTACSRGENKENRIDFLVTSPDNIALTGACGRVRGAGTALLRHMTAHLEEINPGLPIDLKSTFSAEEFYKSHGFQYTSDETDMAVQGIAKDLLIREARGTIAKREPALKVPRVMPRLGFLTLVTAVVLLGWNYLQRKMIDISL